MIPTYRYVQYADDGIAIFQCLSCKRRFLTTDFCNYNTSYKFCPHCGVRFQARKKCRQHNIPRWFYERFGNEYDHEILTPKKPAIFRTWVKEQRTKLGNNDWSDWSVAESFKHQPHQLDNWKTAVWRFDILEKDDEDDDWFKVESRVIVV